MVRSLIIREEDIAIQELDGDLFLADGKDGSIYRLNTTGAALWRALESPVEIHDLEELFICVFPSDNPDSIRRDISKLVDDLETNGLIRRMSV